MGQNNEISVFVVDDHPLVRLGIKSYFYNQPRFRCVGEASNGVEALPQIISLAPDIAIVDVVMPHMDGLALTSELHKLSSKPKILLLTAIEEFIDVHSAFFSGADGLITKDVSQSQFLEVLDQIMLGKKVYFKSMFHLLVDKNLYRPKNEKILKFTKLQQAIIARRLRGYIFPEIAEELNLSFTQISNEINYILEALEDTELVFRSF